MKKLISFILLSGFVLLMVGCGGAQIINVDNSHYLERPQKMSKVERAIRSGATKKGWRVKKIKNGLLEASINVRNRHQVVVNIPYTKQGYKINYKRSNNLKYDPSKNTIHKNYNKWIASLVNNIDYELANIGIVSNNTTVFTPKVTKTKKTTPRYTKRKDISLAGKTIYIKSMAPYANNSRIASNIKAECTINKQLIDFIVQYSAENGMNVVVKNNISPKDIELKIQIDDAVSLGGAWRGHNKYTVISGKIIKGKKVYYSFDAGRLSGGGFWGGYKSSCSVLGRTVDTLGKDVAIWLTNPYDGAKLGDTQLIH